jgi:hypothetical protein
MMVNSGASARLDLEQAAPHRRFDAELRRNCSLAFRAGRLQRALVEFTRVSNTNNRRIAHRFTRGYRSKARDPIAAVRTNLALRTANLYPTLVDVGRALVARTQTLVCHGPRTGPTNDLRICRRASSRSGQTSSRSRRKLVRHYARKKPPSAPQRLFG